MTATPAAGAGTGAGARARRAHAPGTLTQVTGLALVALAPLTMVAVGLIAGADLAEAVFLVVPGVVVAGTAVLALRSRTWTTITGLVVTALVVLVGFWVAFGLFAPSSPADFVPAVMFVTGVVLSVAGGVQAIRNRATTTTSPTRGEARARTWAIAIVAVALVGSVVANLTTRSSVADAEAAGATPVTMGAFEFPTSQVTVTAGEDTRLLVSNSDVFVHDIALPDHGIEAVTITPGSQALVDVSGLAAGTYTFYCTLHSDTSVADPDDAGMAGTLIVE